MQIKEVMSKNPQIATPDQSIREAAQLMRDCDCGYLPVGENDRLTGAITDRDIVVRAIAQGRDPETAKVSDVMTQKIQYCFEDDTLETAAEHMEQQQIRRLVVLNRDKRIVGVVSVGDVATRCGDTQLTGGIESKVCRKAA